MLHMLIFLLRVYAVEMCVLISRIWMLVNSTFVFSQTLAGRRGPVPATYSPWSHALPKWCAHSLREYLWSRLPICMCVLVFITTHIQLFIADTLSISAFTLALCRRSALSIVKNSFTQTERSHSRWRLAFWSCSIKNARKKTSERLWYFVRKSTWVYVSGTWVANQSTFC